MVANHDAYLKMTSDDLRAARVLTLAVKFFGTKHPISSTTINADLYPDLDPESFRRQYLRDRDLLGTFGLIICEAGTSGNDQLWKVDEQASYVQDTTLSSDDARMLYVLCYDLASDQSFAYRDELRMALAKISQMYRGSVVARPKQGDTSSNKILSVLVTCMAAHHACSVTYTDAHGATSERTLALLGSFGLRDRTYFVASRIEQDGSLIPDSARTYRLDRFSKAHELRSLSYQIPLDFSVSDYERLPFQMGDTCGVASIPLTGTEGREVIKGIASQGTVCEQDGRRVWQVPYSDLQAMASWCVGVGAKPQAPAELVTTWHQILEETAGTDLLASLSEPTGTTTPAEARKRVGRTGSVTIARQLIALASSLTREGEPISADDIATTLGVDYDQARHLIALVSMGSGESIDYLPVILSDNDDEVALMEGAQMHARRVRLTRSETMALTEALAELGVDAKDPLVQTLSASFAEPSALTDDLARSIEEREALADVSVLKLCSKAISERRGLQFSYHPVSGGPIALRTVVPQLVRRNDESFYLDAFDVQRQAQRVFRLDRMDDVRLVERPQMRIIPTHETASQVLMRFDDPRYLDLFHWEGMQVLAREGQSTLVRLPAYGGTWLARHIAACAGTVRTSDQALASQASVIARTLRNA